MFRFTKKAASVLILMILVFQSTLISVNAAQTQFATIIVTDTVEASPLPRGVNNFVWNGLRGVSRLYLSSDTVHSSPSDISNTISGLVATVPRAQRIASYCSVPSCQSKEEAIKLERDKESAMKKTE